MLDGVGGGGEVRDEHVHYTSTLHVHLESESFTLMQQTLKLSFTLSDRDLFHCRKKLRSDSVAVGAHDNTSSPS